MKNKKTQSGISKRQFVLLLGGAVLSMVFGGLLNIFKKDKVEAKTGYGSSRYGM